MQESRNETKVRPLCVLCKTPSLLLLFVMPVVVLAIRVWIQYPDEVFTSCAEFARLSLDLLRPSSVSCNAMSDMDSQEQDS